jgi:nicotinamidase-related amidase
MLDFRRTSMLVMLLLVAGCAAMAQSPIPVCRTALLVIDVQKAWLEGSTPLTVDHVDVASKIAGILEPVRSAGIPVIFIVDVSLRTRYSESMLALAEPLVRLDSDLLIEKLHQNAFLETPLDADLQAMGITTLLITGYASHECVASTVIGALEHGFEILIIEDGHSGGGGGQWAGQMNAIWRQRGLQIVASTEIDFAALCGVVAPTGSE